MEIQLKRLRKEAGFKNTREFADALGDGFTARRITSWETGDRMISLEQACVLADFLGCTLDELAGRRFSPPSAEPADPARAELVRCYDACTPQWRDQVLMSARASALASGEAAQRDVDADDQGQAAG